MATTNGAVTTRDEIAQRLEAMTLQALRALAIERSIPASRNKETLVERLSADPSVRSRVWIGARTWATVTELEDRVGTAGAARILKVERPRIGRWVSRGTMPMPVAWLDSGPIWKRTDIEAMREAVDARRRD